ncbi:cyclin-dependent protein kinase inhibitor SMR6-like [Lotus japonicus]|uniref:Cyclin-dependent protein kinase inhibitor SMR6 n=1 Tax=Lotus japonicus TaxID=34305 RepID=I3SKX4_LOTJA|nr:cyclin-dependent protein kinase inhibitor SMR6-like [Lotus japonicus]AFK37325.1 unknown [Lotus japonicus]AFK40916.1 unknown [Lotus japonicus]
MGLSENVQVEGAFESDNRKWVIAGIALRAPLKPIYTAHVEKEIREDSEPEECLTTPTGEESRIPTVFTCPPAPRKRKPSLQCNYRGVVRKFFTPQELETVFIQRAN